MDLTLVQLLLNLTEVVLKIRFLVTDKILFPKMSIGVVFISELVFFHMENDVVLTDTSSERLWK